MRKIARALLVFFTVGNILPLLYAVTIEGQTPSGTYKQVAVSSTGQLLTAAGANGSPTCSALSFSSVVISSGYAQLLISSSTAASLTISQTLYYVEGPNDLYLSSQANAVAIAPRNGSLWARYPAGMIFSLDAPASVRGGQYAQSFGTATYTILSVTRCGS